MDDSRKPVRTSIASVGVDRQPGDPADTEALHRRMRDSSEEAARRMGVIAFGTAIPAVLSDSQRSTPCPRQPVPLEAGVGDTGTPDRKVSSDVRVATNASRSGGGYVVFVRGAPGWGAGQPTQETQVVAVGR